MADKSNEKKTLLNMLDRIADALEARSGETEEVVNKSTVKKTLLGLLDRIADALENSEPQSGLPEVTSDDNGDVLTVVDGEWDKASSSGGLPAVTSDDDGDVLAVVSGAWAKSSNSLPVPTRNNNGKYLRVDDGKWVIAYGDTYNVLQVNAEEDPDTPGTVWCDWSAIEMYDAFRGNGVVINDDLVVNVTCVQDDVTGENQYTFTVLVINNGTVSAITYTADFDSDSPHYTA